ncbi:xap5,circadian timekeeper [Hordeum vulgare]|nr:xap5,circadian timekeeper [Hordeum vulgare]
MAWDGATDTYGSNSTSPASPNSKAAPCYINEELLGAFRDCAHAGAFLVKSRKTATDETRSSKGEDAAAGRVSELAQESRLLFYAAYWDGTGHMRAMQVRKGDSIGEFLRADHQQLAPEFREVWTTSVENLLYVKEDLVIPHVPTQFLRVNY